MLYALYWQDAKKRIIRKHCNTREEVYLDLTNALRDGYCAWVSEEEYCIGCKDYKSLEEFKNGYQKMSGGQVCGRCHLVDKFIF